MCSMQSIILISLSSILFLSFLPLSSKTTWNLLFVDFPLAEHHLECLVESSAEGDQQKMQHIVYLMKWGTYPVFHEAKQEHRASLRCHSRHKGSVLKPTVLSHIWWHCWQCQGEEIPWLRQFQKATKTWTHRWLYRKNTLLVVVSLHNLFECMLNMLHYFKIYWMWRLMEDSQLSFLFKKAF